MTWTAAQPLRFYGLAELLKLLQKRLSQNQHHAKPKQQ
jgi:hypothetical protein